MKDRPYDMSTEVTQQMFIKQVKQLAKDPEIRDIVLRTIEAELKVIKQSKS